MNQYTSNSFVNILDEDTYKSTLQETDEIAKAAITPELINKAQEINEQINNSQDLKKHLNPRQRDQYTQIFLELHLCMNDGLSINDAILIGFDYADQARTQAVSLYQDTPTEMKQDAYRHMIWNLYSYIGLGELKTRIATANHEWTYAILQKYLEYRQSRINYYFETSPWMSASQIESSASTDADAYAVTYRNQMIQNCKNNLSTFNSFFTANSFIMDFWNNKIGRDYGKAFPYQAANNSFIDAWNTNKLVKNQTTAVTASIRSALHATNSWYI